MEYWSGKKITSLKENEIFVFGSNPTGIHGAGAAKDARAFGAKISVGRGLCGQTYALITKNLEDKAGFTEKATGITYHKGGYRSVSPQQICENIDELYACARNNPDKKFIVTYQHEIGFNGTPKRSLNGYDSLEMLDFFVVANIPSNMVFHESYKEELEKRVNLAKEYEEKQKRVNMSKTEDNHPGYTYFFSLASPFSNFHPASFKFRDVQFSSSEQFMMYSKAKLFANHDIAQEILEINNYPMVQDFLSGKLTREEIVNDKELTKYWNEIQKEVKAFGRKVKNYDDKIWSEKRFNIVSVGVREKFSQNEDLKEILMKTGDTYMVEASPYDKIWGIGLSEYDAKKINPSQWPGENLLGKIFDNLKIYFKNEPKPSKMKM